MGYHKKLRFFDGNMRELWDFDRSSVNSYLFFLIYYNHLVISKTPEINQLEKATVNSLCVLSGLEIKNGHFRAFYCEWLGERRD